MNKLFNTLKVIIADDHELLREGLQVLISKIPEIEVIAEAKNGDHLVKLTRQYKPDVVLTDVKMPEMDGFQATRIIKQEFPHIGIIALSSFDEEALVIDMLNAGATGYLLKNASKQEIKDAVFAAYKDEPYYSRSIKDKLITTLHKGGRSIVQQKIEDLFTEREIEVIQMICDGLSSKEVGTALGLKTRTVERYRDSIMDKMSVNNVAGLVTYAIQHGLFKLPSQKK